MAMTGLAEMYEKGEGVPQDLAEAKRWRDAAEALGAPPKPVSEKDKAENKVAAVEPSQPSAPSDRGVGLLRSFGPFDYDMVSVAFSPDGTRIYALASGGFFMHLNPADGAVGNELGAATSERPCCQLVVSPDGKRLASGSYSNLVMLWDANSGELVRSFKGHSDHVVSVVFSPDGERLVSGSYDGTTRIWDVDSGKQLRSLDPRVGKIHSIALSPDGKLVASGHSSGDIKVWDAAGGRLLHSMKADNNFGVYSLVFTPDSARLLSTGADAKVHVWDLASGDEVIHFGSGYASLCCVAISPDGKVAATGNTDNVVRLWNVTSGASFGSVDHADWIQTIVFSPDGLQLASGANDKTVKLWDMGGAKAAAR